MIKCEECGELMFAWDVAKHVCEGQEVKSTEFSENGILQQVQEPQKEVLADILDSDTETEVDYKITQEDLDEFPDLAEQGLEVGEVVGIVPEKGSSSTGDEEEQPANDFVSESLGAITEDVEAEGGVYSEDVDSKSDDVADRSVQEVAAAIEVAEEKQSEPVVVKEVAKEEVVAPAKKASTTKPVTKKKK